MSIFGRLHLDEVITSLPELGPTVPDGSYSWLVLVGVMVIQTTVPSVLSMYGAVLSNAVIRKNSNEVTILDEKIILPPILLVAFWHLANPWSSRVIKLASSPRLVSVIGIALLAVGVLASGYLASGGVGAYFTNLSAGIVMGVGSNLVLQQTDQILWEYFRNKFALATSMKNFAISLGFIYMPFFTLGILEKNPSETALLMMAFAFVPAAFAALLLKAPSRQRSSPYTLLLSQDNELSVRDSYQITPVATDDSPAPISDSGSIAFTYDDAENDDDVRLFDRTNRKRVIGFKVHQCVVTSVAWVGIKAGELFFWIFVPSLAIIDATQPVDLRHGVALSVAAGIGFLIAVLFSHWNPKSARCRCLMFGCSVLVNALVLLRFSRQHLEYFWLVALAILGGMSLGGLSASQESARNYLMPRNALASAVVSSLVGVAILLFFLVPDALTCLQIVSGIELLVGVVFISALTLSFLRTRNTRRSFISR